MRAVSIISTTSTAFPIRYLLQTFTLRTLTCGVVSACCVQGKDRVAVMDMTAHPHPFRPGSGASVSQPSSQARATAFVAGNLPEPLSVKAGPAAALSTDRTVKDTPLLSVQPLATAAAAILALFGAAAVGLMMHRHRDGGQRAGGHRLGLPTFRHNISGKSRRPTTPDSKTVTVFASICAKCSIGFWSLIFPRTSKPL